ncbi:MBL fold metallo-hydrolase RNA specificity domain-containing protein [Micropruina sonneratiae]|uniref:MBL fold metallo-hydrolase RNA specificity domain-containing protein n=1 Tax=Micropruina sonneratiae TaxID=2986940 RepID=UPI002227621B|nr:MBL fold metallo-hydrolase [Micropruina sp. KQZ13P-5]MCW3159258.1 MBL fold metallo-hydrolase [Micropruina sp. KQZ13P-5]
MSEPISLSFLGGAGTVTGSKHLLTVGNRRVLVDAGMFQGEKRWRELNWAEFPVPPSSIEQIVLTHAHLDHCGYLPALVARGFDGPIWCTAETLKLTEIVLMDAGHLQEREARYAAEGGYSKHDDPLPLYTVADVERTVPLLRSVPYDTDLDLGDGLLLRLTRAGHILGSASVTLRRGDTSVLVSGDLGRHDHPLLESRDVPPGAGYVLVESTYGDREHPDPAGRPHEAMADAIRRAIGRGGSVLIPAFAVDRTPVVLKALAGLRREGRIPDVPIFVNSPMAVAALAVYREAGRKGQLRPDLDLTDFTGLPNLREVTDPEESKRLNRPEQPCIIVSSSGMATGGRVLHHLEHLLPHERNAVIFTGYQGVGTRGRSLLEGATELKFRGRFIPVRAEIVQDSEFSVHADGSDLIDWLAALVPPPRTVFCVHGDPDAAAALADRIHRELGLVAVVPRYREVVSLDPVDGLAPAVPVSPPAVAVRLSPPKPSPQPGPSPVPPSPPPPSPGPGDRLPSSSTRDDDGDQARAILATALGQVPFLPAEQRPAVTVALQRAIALAGGAPGPLLEATNQALYAAAEAVETPGGQSIVALLAHVPKVLGRVG